MKFEKNRSKPRIPKAFDLLQYVLKNC